jgi:spermidine/putrescine transport system permease protein
VENWKNNRAVFWAASLPPIVWLLLFFVAPMALVWAFSFGENRGISEVVVSGTFANYARTLEPLYLTILWKSVIIAGLTTLLCLIMGFPIALAITFAPNRLKVWLLLLVMLPFWTNLLIRTYALMGWLRETGYLNTGIGWLAGLFGVEFEPLKLLYSNSAVVIGLVYVHLPFMVLPLYAALDRLDRSLIEASLDLGAGHMQTIFKVIVPLALPGILTGLLITFVPALGSYLTPDLLGGPDSQMIANVIERQFKRANDWPFGAALSFLLLYATFILIAIQTVVSRNRERGAHG